MARVKHIPVASLLSVSPSFLLIFHFEGLILFPCKFAVRRVARSATPGTPPPSGGSREAEESQMTQGQSKKRRDRPGTKALREISHFQRTFKLLIPAGPFIRYQLSNEVSHWSAEALVALREAAEDHMVLLFEDAMLCTIHAKRVTLMKRGFEFARRLGGKEGLGESMTMLVKTFAD